MEPRASRLPSVDGVCGAGGESSPSRWSGPPAPDGCECGLSCDCGPRADCILGEASRVRDLAEQYHVPWVQCVSATAAEAPREQLQYKVSRQRVFGPISPARSKSALRHLPRPRVTIDVVIFMRPQTERGGNVEIRARLERHATAPRFRSATERLFRLLSPSFFLFFPPPIHQKSKSSDPRRP